MQIGTELLDVLAAHPTPPSFDGPEKRNVARNRDEIGFWTAYLAPAGHATSGRGWTRSIPMRSKRRAQRKPRRS